MVIERPVAVPARPGCADLDPFGEFAGNGNGIETVGSLLHIGVRRRDPFSRSGASRRNSLGAGHFRD
jgi:hypothetical protein